MGTSKLTLSVEPEVIREAKQSAAARNTSVSALFGRLLRAMSTPPVPNLESSPVTRRASGLVELPEDQDDRELLSSALASRYRIDP